MGFFSKINPVKHVKKAFNAVTGKTAKRKAQAAAAAQEKEYKRQQSLADQSARKNRQDNFADMSGIAGLGYEAGSDYTGLSGLGGVSLDGKLHKRKTLGGS